MPKVTWTEEDVQELIALHTSGMGISEIAKSLRRTYPAVRGKLYGLRGEDGLSATGAELSTSPAPEPVPLPQPTIRTMPVRVDRAAVANAELHSAVDTQPLERIRILEGELARLRAQLTWAQRADSPQRTGGLLTLRASDHHYGDKNHLLSCGQSLNQKVAVLVSQYQPDQIQILAGDDWIAGRGIYKEQDLDIATTDVHAQLIVGCMKARELLQGIRAVSAAPVIWRVLKGNHDYANGISKTDALYNMMQNLNQDIPDFRAQMNWDVVTANLAYTGTYNALVQHGYGYSKDSPNSPSFIDQTKSIMLMRQRAMQPHEHYRRVLSGHTHWLSVGIERQVGIYWDTTGGLQRNTRVKLGLNQRPTGWIVYVAPPGLDSNILAPIPVQPDQDTYFREMSDPHLGLANQEDACNMVRAYHKIMEERGDYGPGSDFGLVNEGR